MSRLQLPLKTTRVRETGDIFPPEGELTDGANIPEAPQELLSKEFSWYLTWQLTDQEFDTHRAW